MIVLVRNRNKKTEFLYILSTDNSLRDAEIVHIYENRWSIECFLKSSKSLLKLGTKFESHNYSNGKPCNHYFHQIYHSSMDS